MIDVLRSIGFQLALGMLGFVALVTLARFVERVADFLIGNIWGEM